MFAADIVDESSATEAGVQNKTYTAFQKYE